MSANAHPRHPEEFQLFLLPRQAEIVRRQDHVIAVLLQIRDQIAVISRARRQSQKRLGGTDPVYFRQITQQGGVVRVGLVPQPVMQIQHHKGARRIAHRPAFCTGPRGRLQVIERCLIPPIRNGRPPVHHDQKIGPLRRLGRDVILSGEVRRQDPGQLREGKVVDRVVPHQPARIPTFAKRIGLGLERPVRELRADVAIVGHRKHHGEDFILRGSSRQHAQRPESAGAQHQHAEPFHCLENPAYIF